MEGVSPRGEAGDSKSIKGVLKKSERRPDRAMSQEQSCEEDLAKVVENISVSVSRQWSHVLEGGTGVVSLSSLQQRSSCIKNANLAKVKRSYQSSTAEALKRYKLHCEIHQSATSVKELKERNKTLRKSLQAVRRIPQVSEVLGERLSGQESKSRSTSTFANFVREKEALKPNTTRYRGRLRRSLSSGSDKASTAGLQI